MNDRFDGAPQIGRLPPDEFEEYSFQTMNLITSEQSIPSSTKNRNLGKHKRDKSAAASSSNSRQKITHQSDTNSFQASEDSVPTHLTLELNSHNSVSAPSLVETSSSVTDLATSPRQSLHTNPSSESPKSSSSTNSPTPINRDNHKPSSKVRIDNPAAGCCMPKTIVRSDEGTIVTCCGKAVERAVSKEHMKFLQNLISQQLIANESIPFCRTCRGNFEAIRKALQTNQQCELFDPSVQVELSGCNPPELIEAQLASLNSWFKKRIGEAYPFPPSLRLQMLELLATLNSIPPALMRAAGQKKDPSENSDDSEADPVSGSDDTSEAPSDSDSESTTERNLSSDFDDASSDSNVHDDTRSHFSQHEETGHDLSSDDESDDEDGQGGQVGSALSYSSDTQSLSFESTSLCAGTDAKTAWAVPGAESALNVVQQPDEQIPFVQHRLSRICSHFSEQYFYQLQHDLESNSQTVPMSDVDSAKTQSRTGSSPSDSFDAISSSIAAPSSVSSASNSPAGSRRQSMDNGRLRSKVSCTLQLSKWRGGLRLRGPNVKSNLLKEVDPGAQAQVDTATAVLDQATVKRNIAQLTAASADAEVNDAKTAAGSAKTTYNALVPAKKQESQQSMEDFIRKNGKSTADSVRWKTLFVSSMLYLFGLVLLLSGILLLAPNTDVRLHASAGATWFQHPNGLSPFNLSAPDFDNQLAIQGMFQCCGFSDNSTNVDQTCQIESDNPAVTTIIASESCGLMLQSEQRQTWTIGIPVVIIGWLLLIIASVLLITRGNSSDGDDISLTDQELDGALAGEANNFEPDEPFIPYSFPAPARNSCWWLNQSYRVNLENEDLVHIKLKQQQGVRLVLPAVYRLRKLVGDRQASAMRIDTAISISSLCTGCVVGLLVAIQVLLNGVRGDSTERTTVFAYVYATLSILAALIEQLCGRFKKQDLADAEQIRAQCKFLEKQLGFFFPPFPLLPEDDEQKISAVATASDPSSSTAIKARVDDVVGLVKDIKGVTVHV